MSRFRAPRSFLSGHRTRSDGTECGESRVPCVRELSMMRLDLRRNPCRNQYAYGYHPWPRIAEFSPHQNPRSAAHENRESGTPVVMEPIIVINNQPGRGAGEGGNKGCTVILSFVSSSPASLPSDSCSFSSSLAIRRSRLLRARASAAEAVVVAVVDEAEP